jgi:hypothetical protein
MTDIVWQDAGEPVVAIHAFMFVLAPSSTPAARRCRHRRPQLEGNLTIDVCGDRYECDDYRDKDLHASSEPGERTRALADPVSRVFR